MTPITTFMGLQEGWIAGLREGIAILPSCRHRRIRAAASAALEHQLDVADHHRLVDRLDHVVDRQRGDGDGGERFHLDAGLRASCGRAPRSRSRARSAVSSTSTLDSGSGWQSGISDEVCLAAHDAGEPRGLQRIALLHGRAGRSAAAPRATSLIDPRATASRSVTGLCADVDHLDAPARVDVRQTCLPPSCLTSYPSSPSPCAEKNDRLSSDTVRSTLFSFTSGGTCSAPGEKFRTALMPAATTRLTTCCAGGRGHGDDGDADAVASRDLLEIADVVDRHAAARLLADLRRSALSNSAEISNPSCRKPG